MAIRIRVSNGLTIALCAAETDSQDGDIYLDDNAHVALAAKFRRDWQVEYPKEWAEMDKHKMRDAETELIRWLKEQDGERA